MENELMRWMRLAICLLFVIGSLLLVIRAQEEVITYRETQDGNTIYHYFNVDCSRTSFRNVAIPNVWVDDLIIDCDYVRGTDISQIMQVYFPTYIVEKEGT